MSDRVRIERSALENWVRLSDDFSGEILFSQAFLQFKDIIESSTISLQAPDWMTSASEKYQGYIELDNDLVICLTKFKDVVVDGFGWAAINVKARGRNYSPAASLVQNKLSLESLKDPSKRNVVVSEHAQQRVIQRVKDFPGWDVVLEKSVFVEKVEWAFLSWNSSNYHLLFDNHLALSVKPGLDAWVVTTVMDKTWMEADYQQLKENMGLIVPSRKLPENCLSYSTIKKSVNQQLGPWLVYEKEDELEYWALYPSNKVEKAKGFLWVIR